MKLSLGPLTFLLSAQKTDFNFGGRENRLTRRAWGRRGRGEESAGSSPFVRSERSRRSKVWFHLRARAQSTKPRLPGKASPGVGELLEARRDTFPRRGGAVRAGSAGEPPAHPAPGGHRPGRRRRWLGHKEEMGRGAGGEAAPGAGPPLRGSEPLLAAASPASRGGSNFPASAGRRLGPARSRNFVRPPAAGL